MTGTRCRGCGPGDHTGARITVTRIGGKKTTVLPRHIKNRCFVAIGAVWTWATLGGFPGATCGTKASLLTPRRRGASPAPRSHRRPRRDQDHPVDGGRLLTPMIDGATLACSILCCGAISRQPTICRQVNRR